jgi:FixJ family two-component response regulator
MNRLETVKELSLVRVVDDDLAHCSAMSFMLESKGWTVAAYNSAKEFLIGELSNQVQSY